MPSMVSIEEKVRTPECDIIDIMLIMNHATKRDVMIPPTLINVDLGNFPCTFELDFITTASIATYKQERIRNKMKLRRM